VPHVFTALLDNLSDFIGTADPDGKPMDVNPAGRRMVEMPADLPIESTSIPKYDPDDVRSFASDVIVKEMSVALVARLAIRVSAAARCSPPEAHRSTHLTRSECR
jgi:PAS domain-containing protein